MRALAVFLCGVVFASAVTILTANSSNGEQPGAAKRGPVSAQSAYAQADKRKSAAASVPIVVFAPLYGSSPRIIHVPQPGDRAEATVNIDEADAGDEVVPIPLVRHIKPPQRRDDSDPGPHN